MNLDTDVPGQKARVKVRAAGGKTLLSVKPNRLGHPGVTVAMGPDGVWELVKLLLRSQQIPHTYRT